MAQGEKGACFAGSGIMGRVCYCDNNRMQQNGESIAVIELVAFDL